MVFAYVAEVRVRVSHKPPTHAHAQPLNGSDGLV